MSVGTIPGRNSTNGGACTRPAARSAEATSTAARLFRDHEHCCKNQRHGRNETVGDHYKLSPVEPVGPDPSERDRKNVGRKPHTIYAVIAIPDFVSKVTYQKRAY
jgi:hypothetical protein